jgi:hypothetical protein
LERWISWEDQASPSSGKRHGGRDAHAASVQGTRDSSQAVAGSDGIMLHSGMPARAGRVRRRIALRWCGHAPSQPRPGRIRNDRSGMSPSRQPIASGRGAGAGRCGRGPTRGSEETLVDVAPSPGRSRRKPSGDRVVGLLVVRPGVLVRRVIGTGHPAAGQADHKAHRGARAVPAVPAVSVVSVVSAVSAVS